jgi:hypothetical protein
MPRYTRVRDVATGHHYDLGEKRLAVLLKRGAVEVLDGYPILSGPGARPRRAKHFVDKAGRAATPNKPADDAPADPAQEATEAVKPAQTEGETS